MRRNKEGESSARTDSVLRRPEVKRLTGIGTSTLYALMAKGEFPRPLKLSARSVGWRESDVRLWIETRETAGPRAAAAQRATEA